MVQPAGGVQGGSPARRPQTPAQKIKSLQQKIESLTLMRDKSVLGEIDKEGLNKQIAAAQKEYDALVNQKVAFASTPVKPEQTPGDRAAKRFAGSPIEEAAQNALDKAPQTDVSFKVDNK